MLGFLKASFLGAGLWVFLWATDGRPYSALPWVAGLLLVLVFLLQPEMLRSWRGACVGFALSAGLWATWRNSDGSVGPGNAGSALATTLLPYVALAGLLALAVGLKPRPGTRIASLVWMLSAMAMVCVVGTLSGQGGGASSMAEWVARLLHITVEQAGPIVFYVRKTIHLSFYGFMAYASFWSGWHAGLYAEKAAAYGLSMALLLGSFDELRQSRAIGRSGSPWDVGLDMIGAALFLVLAYKIARGREARMEQARPSPATPGPDKRS